LLVAVATTMTTSSSWAPAVLSRLVASSALPARPLAEKQQREARAALAVPARLLVQVVQRPAELALAAQSQPAVWLPWQDRRPQAVRVRPAA
jgi:hypothetical protein